MRPGHLISVVFGVVIGFAITHLLRNADPGEDAEQAEAKVERGAPRMPRGENESGQEPVENVDGDSPLQPYQPPTDDAGFTAHLEKHGYSSEAMIAVAMLSRDIDHLIEAAERYPDDPHVQLLVIGSHDFPGDKTEWYRRFKESQPDNLLASLLLGSHLLDKGSAEEALAELRAGGGQAKYNDFMSEGALAMEGALIELGQSPFDAKVNSAYGSSIEYAVQLQKGIIDLNQLVESARGDAEKLELATLGVVIGNQLSEGEANRSNANRLFGLSMEKMFLKQLDPDLQSPSFSQTPAEMIEQINAERARLGEEIDAVVEIHERLDERQTMHYLDRVRTLGEAKANAWLLEQFRVE